MKKSDQKVLWRNGSLALLMLGAMIFMTVRYAPLLSGILGDSELFRKYVLGYGQWGALVFIVIQIIHIMVPFIPGEVVQIGGGYIFGTIPASVYLILGMVVGTVIAFYLSRWIGYPIVRIFVKTEKMEHFKQVLDSPRAELALFIMMLIPGFPKDAMIYIAGLSPMSAVRFIVISVLARIPGVIGSAYIGANLQTKDYSCVILVLAIAIVALGLGYCLRKYYLPHHHPQDRATNRKDIPQ